MKSILTPVDHSPYFVSNDKVDRIAFLLGPFVYYER
jgi:hypothetical protein